jgi:hypothetical protein
MENKLIEIQDLEKGDEILISCQSFFKYLKVLVKPSISKTKVHWHTGKPLYGNVRCSTRQDVVVTYAYTDPNGVVHNRNSKEWMVTPEDHNMNISIDLCGRPLWLVKRENNN